MAWLRNCWLEVAATCVAAIGLMTVYTVLAGYAWS